MKKRIVIAALAMFSMLPSLVSANTSTSAVTQQIQALLQQIQALQQQMTNLQQQKQQVVLQIATTLREGTQGDNVTVLQALLAADPSLYPEGLITGFYGKATARAVKRFQEKNGLEGVGFVGPRTLKKLNELLQNDKSNQLAFEGDDANKAAVAIGKAMDKDAKDALKTLRKICVKVAPGHMIAPGWLRKNGGVQPIIPLCQTLPGGIVNNPNWPWTSTSTTDMTAPIISNIGATVDAMTATISWTTNENADTQIIYGTSTAYGFQTTLITTLSAAHSQQLTSLASSTTYHYQVRSKDAHGNLAISSDQVFTTLAQTDTVAPTLSGISASVSYNAATVIWATNEAASTQVTYGTSTAYGSLTSLDSTLVTSHSQNITGLTPSTLYHYQVLSRDVASNLTTSSDQTFTTLAAPDLTSPVISSVVVVPAAASASVSWATDEAATSKVYYGTATPVDPSATSTLSVSNGALVTSHTLSPTGLATSTTYFYLIESVDAANNKATTTGSFATTPS